MADANAVPEVGAYPRPEKYLQYMFLALVAMSVVLQKANRWSKRTFRSGAMHVRTAASKVGSAIMSIRLPVSHAKHLIVTRQLERFEFQSLASVRSIECREKRTRAFLAIARMAHEVGRDTRAYLSAALEELQVEHHWHRKQEKIFCAAQLACSVAGLAAKGGHAEIGRDAYLCGQQYDGRVKGVDRKIGLATAFADVAALLGAGYDQVAWLSTAMDLAVGIEEKEARSGAVNFVARKMVVDRIPPCDNPVVDKRFAVDASPLAKNQLIAPLIEGNVVMTLSEGKEFELEMP